LTVAMSWGWSSSASSRSLIAPALVRSQASPGARHDRTQADHGFTHVGFTSKDIHADYARLKGRGVVFYNKPIEYRPGVWNAYFYGPDGETCEIRQSTERQGPPSQDAQGMRGI